MMPSPVINRTLGDLIGEGSGELSQLPVTDIASSSADVTPGAVFFALPGISSHGLDYLPEAVQKGASAIVYEPRADQSVTPLASVPTIGVTGLSDAIGDIASRFFATDERQGPVIGVTGTNGKTTVAWLISSALNIQGRSAGYIGTLGLGRPPELTPQPLTTPDCITVHRQLAALNGNAVAMEVSSHALDQNRIAGVPVQIGVFCNLSRDHLDYHRDMASYSASKARLFQAKGMKSAVINIDDDFGSRLYDQVRAAGMEVTAITMRGGSNDPNVLRGELWPGERVGLHVKGAGVDIGFDSRLIGGFNGENLLLSFAVLRALELSPADIVASLSACASPPGRMEVFGGGDQPVTVVDFAHTPDALERVLISLRLGYTGKLICVFGCGGDRDRGKRREMGAVASHHADVLVLTDDNPRYEDPMRIIDDILDGVNDRVDIKVEHDRRAAIAIALCAADPGDVVLVAGKGHETTQLRGGEKLPLSDRQLVGDALEALR